MNRYSDLPRFPTASPACTRSPAISGGAGIRGPSDLPPTRLHAVAGDRAQPGADAVARVPRQTRKRRPNDPEFLALYDRAIARLDAARSQKDRWWSNRYAAVDNRRPIAYFSAEFALHQSLPIYAGGLGVLAGDHCKEASDLGVPLIGVGFMYPQGYFHQQVSADGWQEESLRTTQLGRHRDRAGDDAGWQAVRHAVPLGERTVLVQVWRVQLGPVVAVSCSTPTSKRTRRGIASCRRGSTAAIARRASSRRSSSASAAFARCDRSASTRASFTSTKDTPASSSCSAFAISTERGATFDDALEEIRQHDGLHDTHAGAGGTRRVPVPAGREAPRRLLGHPRAESRAVPGLGAYDNGGGSQFNMTALACARPARSTPSARCTAR